MLIKCLGSEPSQVKVTWWPHIGIPLPDVGQMVRVGRYSSHDFVTISCYFTAKYTL